MTLFFKSIIYQKPSPKQNKQTENSSLSLLAHSPCISCTLKIKNVRYEVKFLLINKLSLDLLQVSLLMKRMKKREGKGDGKVSFAFHFLIFFLFSPSCLFADQERDLEEVNLSLTTTIFHRQKGPARNYLLVRDREVGHNVKQT